MLVTAVQAPEVTLRYPPVLYPIDPNLKGFHAIFFEKQMGKWLINSGFVAILTTAITTAFSILGAYGLVGSEMCIRDRVNAALYPDAS